MATVLNRPAPAPLAFRPVTLPVRRPGSVCSGSPPPILQPMRMPPPESVEECVSCGNAYMPDAIFCRHCGQKREQVETQSVQSINYNSVFSGVVSPTDGAVYETEVAAALYGVGFSGTPVATPEVYPVAAANVLHSGGVSGAVTPGTPGAPVYHVTDPLHGGLSGTQTPGARVYHMEAAYGGLSGTVTPTSGGAPAAQMVYQNFDPSYGTAASLPQVRTEAAPSRGGMSGTVTPTSGGAPVVTYATQPGMRPRPPVMEPTTLAAPHSTSLPTSCELPATPTTSATSAPRVSQLPSTRFSSYTPAPIQVSAVPTQASIKPASGPRLSVSIPTVPMTGWTTPPALVEKQVPEPHVPPSLTAGLPDPTSIERQKNAYARGLEEQLRHGTDVLAQQLKQQSDYLFAMGDQRKRQFALQVDQEIKQREMELAQQHNEQLLLLQQAAQQQKSALEHQANALLLEYNQKKAQEDLSYQQYQFQKKQYETQLQYNEEMKELQVQQSAAQQQVAHQRACIAQQAAEATQQAEAARQARATHPGMAPLVVAPPTATMYPVPQKTFAALP